jgi:hypothetical protein
VVLSLLVVAPVLGQTHRASLRGTVYDPNKAVIPGAAITLTNAETSESRTTTSNDEGEYTIASIPAGVYQLDIEKSPFVKFSLRIELLVNQTRREDVTLQVGTPGIVTVDAPFEAVLKKDTASLGTVIENRQITGLPLDGRNFYELSLLVPGAVPPAQGSAGSVRGDFAFSVNGAREDANNFLLDGVYNVDPKLNTFGVRPSVDAIREF